MFGGKRYLGLHGMHLQIAVGVIAGLDFLLFGYDQGVMGGLLTLSAFRATFPSIDTVADTSTPRAVNQGIAVASYNVGCFFGAITCIFVGNPLGRRRTIFLGSSIMIVGATIMASSFSLTQFIIGRVITGFGNGLNTSTVPTWQSECSRSHRRGMLVMIEGALITGGICVSYWLDFGLYFTNPSTVAWRFPIAFQIIFCVIILIFVLALPESPRWLIMKGKEDEAMNVLAALGGNHPDDSRVMTEFSEIKDGVLEESQGSFKDLFTMGPDRHFHRVCLAYVNQVFQQISGINLITYYVAAIFQNYLHLGDQLSRILAAANGTEYFLASWIAVFTIEKFGRRPLMIFGAAGQSICMICLTLLTWYLNERDPNNKGVAIADACFLFLFNTFFAIGWLGMTWLYPAEIVPLRIRAPANALATSANWAFNFMVVMITPISFASIAYRTYIIFAVINAFIVPVVYFCYPETAYRSLEEMDTIFRKTTSIFNVVKIAKNEPRRYGKNGELLIDYTQTEEFARRKSSVTGIPGGLKGVMHERADEEKGSGTDS